MIHRNKVKLIAIFSKTVPRELSCDLMETVPGGRLSKVSAIHQLKNN